MAQIPWENRGFVQMVGPLHSLSAHPEKWLPKFNLDDGLPTEEHINNFMLSINLNEVVEEYAFVILFPYTLQGSAGSWYFSLPFVSINSWDAFQEQFLTKFGDDQSTATLLKDLYNLKVEPKEPIKDFNSHFNKLLNKIPTTSKPSDEVQNEWYISALPSNATIFVDSAAKPTLAENMKESIAVEKRILSLHKKNALEEIKSKKVTFRDESKKKAPKDPFDLEGLQKVLKTTSNEMVDIKKQVAETSSRKPYRPYKRNPSYDPKPPSTISNVESDVEEEEISIAEEQTNDEEVVELQEIWDFILPNEESQEALLVATRSRRIFYLPQTSQKQKSSTLAPEDKAIGKKSSPKPTQTTPSQSNFSPSTKTLLVSDEMEYNIVEDMKETRANITFHELSKLKHQQKLFLKELKAVPTSPLSVIVISQAAQEMGRPPSTLSNKVNSTDISRIAGRSKSHTPPFLLNFEVFNKNLHNCLVDFGASSNILPKIVCEKLNVEPQKFIVHIMQLGRSQVEVIGELNQVTIRLSSNQKVCQVIDILVVDIPEFYSLILSRDWSENLHGYFATNWSHMSLSYNGKLNQIRVHHEKHKNCIITELEGENEPVAYSNNIIGNYSVESIFGNFNENTSPFLENSVISQVENYSQTDTSKCISFVDRPIVESLFWKLYFDGSKSNDGAGAGCILVSLEGEKTMLACRLKFECTNSTVEYEALVQGLNKSIGLDIKYLQVFRDS